MKHVLSATVIDLGEGFVTLDVSGLAKSAELTLSPDGAREFIPYIASKGAIRVIVESVPVLSAPGADDAPDSSTNHRWGHASGCLCDAASQDWGCVPGCQALTGPTGALAILRQAGRIVCDADPNNDADTLRRVMRLVEHARVALAESEAS